MPTINSKTYEQNFLSPKVDASKLFVYFLFIPLLIIYHFAYGYDLPEVLRSIFYILPFAGLIVLFICNLFSPESKLKLSVSYIQLAVAFLVIVAIGLYLNAKDIYFSTFYRDILIFVMPLLLFAFEWRFSERQFNWLFITAVFSFAAWKQFDLELNILNTILTTSQSDTEYHFGCVVGIFVIYYLYKKKWLLLAISILFLSLVSKRASLLGLFAAVPIYYFIIKPAKLYDKKLWLFVCLFCYYMFFWMIGTNIEFFGKLFLNIIGKGEMDLDYFLTGRMILVNLLQPEILDRGFLSFMFGNGPGQAEVFLWKTMRHANIYLWMAKPFLVHNDFLKMQFEIGFIGATLSFFIFYYLYAVSRLGIFIFLYTIPLFLIDNTIIYLYNILVGCIAARVFDKSTPNEYNIFSSFFGFFRRG
ncbi:MAG: hypothetical protein ACKVOU_14455 [Cytophagales bacterium]